jgi:exodeoxyribonuclease VII small subunit
MTTDTPTPLAGFEQALSELESLVDSLEKGDLSLEASLAAFERGIGLARTCQKTLDEAEQRVLILTAKSAEAALEPFADHD